MSLIQGHALRGTMKPEIGMARSDRLASRRERRVRVPKWPLLRAALVSALVVLPAVAPTTLGRAAAESARTRAARECWMMTEKTAKKMDLDLNLVNRCIEKKMRGLSAPGN